MPVTKLRASVLCSATSPMVLALAVPPRSAAKGSVWSPTYPSAKAPWV